MKVIASRLPIVAMSIAGMVVTGIHFDRFDPVKKAAILAHEEGHIYHMHGWTRFKWIVTGQWKHLLYRCRLQEFEADAFAVKLGHSDGLLAFLKVWREAESRFHPSTDDRIGNIKRLTTA
jgi:Zn-dependent protease with chaperone function